MNTVTAKTKPMKIKAFWSVYGIRIHRAGKNLDMNGNSSYSCAIGIFNLIKREGYTGEVEFSGNCADEVKTDFDDIKKIEAANSARKALATA